MDPQQNKANVGSVEVGQSGSGESRRPARLQEEEGEKIIWKTVFKIQKAKCDG